MAKFVWRANAYREAVADPIIWHDDRPRNISKPQYANYMHIVAQHEITDTLAKLPIEELAKQFPPPDGYKAA